MKRHLSSSKDNTMYLDTPYYIRNIQIELALFMFFVPHNSNVEYY